MTKARDLGKLVSQGQLLADGVVQASEVSGLATVATSGSYNDLTNKPTNLGGVTSYTDLTNKPTFATVATTGSYADLTNKPTIPTLPTLATVATTGSYADLTNKPTIFSGSYTDLTNKPTIFSGSYTDLTNKPTIFSGNYTDLTNKPTLATVATTGSYTDLTNKPTIISLKGTSITYPGDDLAADIAGGQTIIITGTGFESTPTVYIGGVIAPSVTFVSATQLSVTIPAKTAGTYDVYIVNPGGATAIMVMGISYSGVPAWTTSAGSLGAQEADFTIQLLATSNSAVTYALASGSTLPSGVTLSSSGLITGSAISVEQTFNFTVSAIDAERQDTPRSFSVTVSLGEAYFKYVTLLLTGDGSSSAQNNTFLDSSGIGSTTATPTSVLDPSTAINGWFTRTGSAQSNYNSSPREFTVRANGVTIYNSTSSFPSSVTYNGVTYTPGTYVDSGYGWSGDYINRFGITANSAVFTQNITRNGNVAQGTFSPYGTRWSNYFSGTSSQALTTPNSYNYQFGTNNFTVEAWVYFTSLGTWNIVAQCADNATWANGWTFYVKGDGTLGIWHNSTSTNSNPNLIKTNTWYHIAVTRQGYNLRLFLNGTGVAADYANAENLLPTRQLTIGGEYNTGSYLVNGYVSNVRVAKNNAIYTDTFTPSTTPLTAVSGTQLLTCQSNRFIDNSSNAVTITSNTAVSIQRFSPFGPGAKYTSTTIGGSAYFDGNGDYLSAGSQSVFAVGTNDFTFQTWVYPTAWTSPVSAIFENGTSVSGNRFAVVIYNGGTVKIDSNTNLLVSSTPLILNQWTFISIVRSSGTMTMYFNGTNVASGSVTQNFSQTQGDIGKTVDNYYYKGYISDLHLVNGTALTNTIPNAPLTNITNTSLLLNMTNAGIIDNSMMADVETANTAQINTTTKKYGTGSIQVSNGSYLAFRQNPALYALPGDFTIEFWLYKNSASQYAPIIETRGADDTTTGVYIMDYNSTMVLYPHYTVAPSIETNTWIHFAFVRSGDTLTIYKNGTSAGSVSCPIATYTYSAGNLWINAFQGNGASGRYLDGYLDDVRITKGYARYTSNFTAPTSAFRIS